MKFTRIATVGAVLVASAVMASAQSFTVATFADPSNTASSPVFSFVTTGANSPTGNTGSLTGSWTAAGLNLLTPGIPAPDYTNAKVSVGAVGGGALNVVNGAVAAGQIVFTTSANAAIMTISFASATYSPFGVGAATLLGQGVTFSGPAAPSGLTNGSFSFSFANQTVGTNLLTATSSFTSSAVPEPATLGSLAIGAFGLLARRRKNRS